MALILRHCLQFLFQKQGPADQINITAVPYAFFQFVRIGCQDNLIQGRLIFLRQLPDTVELIFDHIIDHDIQMILKSSLRCE